MTSVRADQSCRAASADVPDMDATRKDIVRFPSGLPGFEACRGFLILASDDAAPLQRLHSVDGPPASFLAIDPALVMPTYRCELSEMDRQRLGATEASVLLWLALLMIEEDGTVTVNLRAPLVVNPERMLGCQVMPHDCLYPVRHVLMDAGQ